MYKFNDIEIMMHTGAAILHAHRYCREEIKDNVLFQTEPPLATLLLKIGIIDGMCKLTPLGNEVFACPLLIRYYHLIQPELCSKTPRKMDYDYLRAGLNQHIVHKAIEYVDFIHSLMFIPKSVCDLGGGGGMYLQLVCEHFGSEAYLIDKDTLYAQENLPGDYHIEEADFLDAEWRSEKKYDMVLLNEVLHLLGSREDISYVIRLCHQLINPGGYLIIGENQYSEVLDWRLSLLSKGQSIAIEDLMNLLDKGFKTEFSDEVVLLTLDSHYYIALRKT